LPREARSTTLALVGLALAALLVLACASPASAQVAPSAEETARSGADEEARTLFVEGRAAFDAGRFDSAARAFRRAYSLSPRPELLYNLAFALDRLRADEEALERYRAYLDAAPESPNRPSVEARIAALERAVAERRAEAEERARLETEGGTPWWLWASIGGAVVVVLAVVVIVVASSGQDVSRSPPVPGDDGMVIEALSFP
jgi:tetratricopeptide (TPR) repeat protein